MKMVKEKNKIIIYILSKQVDDLDIDNKEELEKFFGKLFLKIKKIGLTLKEFYTVHIYYDVNYGVIIELENESDDLLFETLDINIIIDKKNFIYKLEDCLLLKYLEKKEINLYKYDNNLYLYLNEKINKSKYFKILENLKIIYDPYVVEQVIKKTNQIL